jgi:hypothetical protein
LIQSVHCKVTGVTGYVNCEVYCSYLSEVFPSPRNTSFDSQEGPRMGYKAAGRESMAGNFEPAMSFSSLISGADCSTSSNPLSQVLKHTDADNSLQRVSCEIIANDQHQLRSG